MQNGTQNYVGILYFCDFPLAVHQTSKTSNVHYLHPLISHFVSLHFNGHFTGEPGLAGVY